MATISCLQSVLFVRPFPCAVCHLCCEPYLNELLKLCEVSLLDFFRIGCGRGQLKCDGTHAETRFRLSAKGTSPFQSAGASVQSTTGSRGLRISGSNAGYTMFRGSVKGTGYPLHSPVSPSLPLPCVTVCHHISNSVYYRLLAVATNGRASGILNTVLYQKY